MKAKHHSVIYPFFQQYALRKIKRSFSYANMVGEMHIKEDHSVLLLMNHVSWWDGFWAMYVNLKLIHKRFHFMMLEDQLKKFWFFNYTGAFSVKKDSRSIIESLNYAAELLEKKGNMVLMFPQGELRSMHEQSFQFEKGVERILTKTKNDVQVLFAANLVDYKDQAKPGVTFYLEVYKGEASTTSIQKAYQRFYDESVNEQKRRNKG